MTVVSLKSAHNGCFNRHRVDLQYDSHTTKASSSDIVHSSKLHVYLMHGDIAMPMNVWTAEDNSFMWEWGFESKTRQQSCGYLDDADISY